jgi:hypothetical protein
LPSVEQARQAARESASQNNLKNLQLAMLNYEAATRSFPAASSSTYDKHSQRLTSEHSHSWRVTLLPFLDQQPLYEQYRFDEPWDSEANKKVLEQMPEIYRSPHDPDPQSMNTSYFVLTGEETVFPKDKAVRISRITDGTSRTFSIVEAKRPVPWTKPEDIEYAADKPVPKLGGWMPGYFIAALVDGSVHRVSNDGDVEGLRPWITRAGGERADVLPAPK